MHKIGGKNCTNLISMVPFLMSNTVLVLLEIKKKHEQVITEKNVKNPNIPFFSDFYYPLRIYKALILLLVFIFFSIIK